MQTYLTLTELRAKLGGRSRSAIYLDLEAGRLPQPVKLGGKLYWPEGDVDAFLRDRINPDRLRAEAAAMLAHAEALEAEGKAA